MLGVVVVNNPFITKSIFWKAVKKGGGRGFGDNGQNPLSVKKSICESSLSKKEKADQNDNKVTNTNMVALTY